MEVLTCCKALYKSEHRKYNNYQGLFFFPNCIVLNPVIDILFIIICLCPYSIIMLVQGFILGSVIIWYIMFPPPSPTSSHSILDC